MGLMAEHIHKFRLIFMDIYIISVSQLLVDLMRLRYAWANKSTRQDIFMHSEVVCMCACVFHIFVRFHFAYVVNASILDNISYIRIQQKR